MKKLLIFTVLFYSRVNSQSVYLGYAPVNSIECSFQYGKNLFVETGLKAHLDLEGIGAGFISCGYRWKWFSASTGIGFGANREVQDRYVIGSDTVFLHGGAKKNSFWTPNVCARIEYGPVYVSYTFLYENFYSLGIIIKFDKE